MTRLHSATISILLALVIASPAHATLLRTFSLAELVRASHAIVRGEIIAQEAAWDPLRAELYTDSSIRLDDVFVGRESPGDVIVLRQIGGTLDNVSRHVVGTANLSLGDEVVLFTRTDGAFHYLVGMAQGAYHLERSGSLTAETPLVRRARPPLVAAIGPSRPLAPDALTLHILRVEIARLRAEAQP